MSWKFVFNGENLLGKTICNVAEKPFLKIKKSGIDSWIYWQRKERNNVSKLL